MKTVKIGIGLLTVVMVVMGQQLDGVSYSSNNDVFKRAVVFCQAKMTCLQAGYGYTQEEKDNAREEIAELKKQRKEIIWPYYKALCRKDLSDQERKEYWHSIASSVYKFDDDIRELQLITGDVWSDDRKQVWSVVALIAAGLVGCKFFSPSIIAFVTKNRKNSDELAKKQKEQEQQLKEAKDQRKIEKNAKKVAKKEKELIEAQKQKEETAKKEAGRVAQEKAEKEQRQAKKKIKEQVRQVEAEKAEKAEQKRIEELCIINNKNIVDSQKRVNDIEKEIIEINNVYKDGGEVDQGSANRLQLLREQLSQEQDKLQNCILRAKVDRFEREQRLNAVHNELAKQRKQDQREINKKILIAMGNALIKAGKIIAQLTKDGFMALKARSRLSKEDQELIVRSLF